MPAPEWDPDQSDPPLLNRPNLMLTVLRVAAGADDAGIGACVDRVTRDLKRINEEAGVPREEIGRRIDVARVYLTEAGLLERARASRFRITGRGREVLAAHPNGIDMSVLRQFAEFQAFVESSARRPHPEERAREPSREYDAGFGAYQQGMASTDNPYDLDTVAHLEWMNGWFEAFDEDREHQAAEGRRERT